ncbi:hypothetical protein PPL_09987 [Heterostelium album PN500]|uniref:Uncharacterized protein n=1 Tax=Heterostelium pallidum (strain ATCC 26659 / Pp 5 / PN500) TaxID=670386 RepID=D3BPU3_HETP5|nr:hypothetical protein PPL_09987 [Heterostelium album PN500]EFA76226.1 hypothetical protein PPL_09987 [Heterostelium album PN500]|eukprot:XP_020428359.1 hypothetical protein PPL_09987 [Heterostelium album PN500]
MSSDKLVNGFTWVQPSYQKAESNADNNTNRIVIDHCWSILFGVAAGLFLGYEKIEKLEPGKQGGQYIHIRCRSQIHTVPSLLYLLPCQSTSGNHQESSNICGCRLL